MATFGGAARLLVAIATCSLYISLSDKEFLCCGVAHMSKKLSMCSCKSPRLNPIYLPSFLAEFRESGLQISWIWAHQDLGNALRTGTG